MKIGKQFLSILISVLICVFVFGIIVYATTTIGNDVTVSGILTVNDGIVINNLNDDNDIGISASVSADIDGMDIYGMKQEVTVGTGVLSAGARYATGIYQELTNNADEDIGYTSVPDVTGILQIIDLTEDAVTTKQLTGFQQEFSFDSGAVTYSGDNTYLQGFNSELRIGGIYSVSKNYQARIWTKNEDSIAQEGTLFDAQIFEVGAGDIIKGLQITDSPPIGEFGVTGGTGYGLYLDLDEVWTDAYNIYIVDGSAKSYFGNATSSFGGDVEIGNGTAGHLEADTENLYVEGILEVDGTAHFDGVVSASDANGMMVGGGAKFFGGTASPDFSCMGGSLYIKSGTGDEDTSLYLCNPANTWNAINFTTL
jgi:hypothetical protein